MAAADLDVAALAPYAGAAIGMLFLAYAGFWMKIPKVSC